MPNPYSSHGMYAAPLDSKSCAAGIWYSMGNGSGHKQCDRPGVYKVGKHKWCKQHARQFPVDEQPEELRPKRVEGARWWPGQTVYRALNRWGELKLMTAVVKTVRKDGLELTDRAPLSDHKAVASTRWLGCPSSPPRSRKWRGCERRWSGPPVTAISATIARRGTLRN